MAESKSRPRSAEIRTPDQRLRVCVSSTLEELSAERRAVERAVTAYLIRFCPPRVSPQADSATPADKSRGPAFDI